MSSSKQAPQPVVKKTKPTQDPSGHISMSVAEAAFIRDVNHRFDRIEYMRLAGTLEQCPSRNPLRAEKTPRHKQLSCDDYAIPPLPDNLKQPKRWDYPESDWGLMAKFQSQKQIYDKIFAMKQNYTDSVAKFQAEKAMTMQLEEEKNKMSTARGENNNDNVLNSARNGDGSSSSRLMNTARAVIDPSSSDTSQLGSGRLNSSRVSIGNDSMSSSSSSSSLQSSMSSRRDESNVNNAQFNADDLYYQKISTMKSLQGVHPEILAKWRAKRASEFVVTQKHPLDPPTARDLTARPFKPGGGNVRSCA